MHIHIYVGLFPELRIYYVFNVFSVVVAYLSLLSRLVDIVLEVAVSMLSPRLVIEIP